MQEVKKHYYIIQNGLQTIHNVNFETKREAITYCIGERELDLKIGSATNVYEVYSYNDPDRKVLYTTKDVIYKFMRDKYPALYPPKIRTIVPTIDFNKRCDKCFRFICSKGAYNLCLQHYEESVGNKERQEIIKVESKIDIAKAISHSIK